MTFTTEQMRFWSPEVRELEPYVPGEQPKIQILLKLNTNENPYPPSPKVVEAVQAVLTHQADALRLYPDPDATALKQAIAKQQHVDVAQVFVGNGSDEVLAHIFKAFFIFYKISKLKSFCYNNSCRFIANIFLRKVV